MDEFANERELIAIAIRLACNPKNWSRAERNLTSKRLPRVTASVVNQIRGEILGGRDPLGVQFCRLRSPEKRRNLGATYTPAAIVKSMIAWAANEHVQPSRVVDPGAGSGRFLSFAADRFPLAQLVGVECDPVAALMLRATAAVTGFADRLDLRVCDYRSINLEKIQGATLFIGNPPYVRHHRISSRWKRWFKQTAAQYDITASSLAGLHIHFFLKTLALARDGDYGAFITAAEWLDTNYGAALRQLLGKGLGGTGLHVLHPTLLAFEDADTTAAITRFKIGSGNKSLRVQSVRSECALNELGNGRDVSWSIVNKSQKWSSIVRPSRQIPDDYIELGELFRVHRGQVTGANDVWIEGPHSEGLPQEVLFPTVTKARELIQVGSVLDDVAGLKCVIDLPVELDNLPTECRRQVDKFLKWAKELKVDSGYIAKSRRAWWSVGLKEPAPIVCTYMARRPPVFVQNVGGARLLNIAHGLYPREPLPKQSLSNLVAWLNANVRQTAGRAYAGGLTKFEPREVERIPIPPPEQLDG